jgi:hypothetical protein
MKIMKALCSAAAVSAYEDSGVFKTVDSSINTTGESQLNPIHTVDSINRINGGETAPIKTIDSSINTTGESQLNPIHTVDSINRINGGETAPIKTIDSSINTTGEKQLNPNNCFDENDNQIGEGLFSNEECETLRNVTKCKKERKEELDKMLTNENRFGSVGGFLPQCDSKGYAPMQSHGSSGSNFCVYENGKEIEGAAPALAWERPALACEALRKRAPKKISDQIF